MMRTCGIYELLFLNGKTYIGSSNQIETRFYQHSRELRKGIHCNVIIQNCYNKHNKIINFKILLICKEVDLLFYEQLCIDKFKPELNVSVIAGRLSMTAEINARISATHKARGIKPPSRLGMRNSEERRRKLSESHKGLKPSAENIAKRSAKIRGRTQSIATIEKRRATRLRNKLLKERL